MFISLSKYDVNVCGSVMHVCMVRHLFEREKK